MSLPQFGFPRLRPRDGSTIDFAIAKNYTPSVFLPIVNALHLREPRRWAPRTEYFLNLADTALRESKERQKT
jgi:hypothetical protein